MELEITLKSGQVITTFPTKVEYTGWPRQILMVYHGTKVDEYPFVEIQSFVVKSLQETTIKE